MDKKNTSASYIVMLTKSACCRRRTNGRNVSTSLLLYGGITYFINSFYYPNLLLQVTAVFAFRRQNGVGRSPLIFNNFGILTETKISILRFSVFTAHDKAKGPHFKRICDFCRRQYRRTRFYYFILTRTYHKVYFN